MFANYSTSKYKQVDVTSLVLEIFGACDIFAQQCQFSPVGK